MNTPPNLPEPPSELRAIRRALLQAALEDYEEALADAPPAPRFSRAYRRWRKTLLQDPNAILAPTPKPARRPAWTRPLRTAACILLALSVSFSAALLTSPRARAWVVSWFVVETDTYDEYSFTPQTETNGLLLWAPTYLPKGYIQTDYTDAVNFISISYDTDTPEMVLEFSYHKMVEGGGWGLDNERHTASAVPINNMEGRLYTATDDSPNMLVWFDEATGYTFFLGSKLPTQELIKIAESVQIDEK